MGTVSTKSSAHLVPKICPMESHLVHFTILCILTKGLRYRRKSLCINRYRVLPVGNDPTTNGLRVRSPVKSLIIDQESPKYAPSTVQERSLNRPSIAR